MTLHQDKILTLPVAAIPHGRQRRSNSYYSLVEIIEQLEKEGNMMDIALTVLIVLLAVTVILLFE
jgi:hypothetical protein